METLGAFVARFTGLIGCYHHKCNSEIYSLKRNDTMIRGRMGVFAWVQERKRKNVFEVSTYKILGDGCNVSYLADKVVPEMHYVSKKKDGGEGTGIVFYVQKGSGGKDYEKAVKALKAINSLK